MIFRKLKMLFDCFEEDKKHISDSKYIRGSMEMNCWKISTNQSQPGINFNFRNC